MLNYVDISYNQISLIKDLWEKNRKYHENISKYFGYTYSNIIFEERIGSFAKYDEDHIKITVARNSANDVLGYCISVIEGGEGETKTLHVVEGSRGFGIGKELMKSHIEWLKNKCCKDITITVAFENVNTIEFYKSLGFKENTIEMRLI